MIFVEQHVLPTHTLGVTLLRHSKALAPCARWCHASVPKASDAVFMMLLEKASIPMEWKLLLIPSRLCTYPF